MRASRDHEIESQLDQSERQRKIQEIKHNNGTQICDLIDAILSDEEKIPKKLATHALSTVHANLVHATEKLRKVVLDEEAKRNRGAEVDHDMTEKLKTSRHQYALLENQLEIFKKSYEADQKQYEEDLKTIQAEKKEAGKLYNQQEIDAITKLAVLTEQRNIKKDKYERAELAYEKKCCCFPSFVADEKRARDKAKIELDAADDIILDLHNQKDQTKNKIDDCDKKEKELKTALRKLITENPVNIKLLQDSLIAAKEAVDSAEADYESAEKKLKSEVSTSSMLSYLRVYVCFDNFQQQVKELEEKNPHNKELTYFRQRLPFDGSELDALMQKVWCQDPARRNALQVYRDIYCEQLSPDERAAVVSGQFTPALQKKIVPFVPRIGGFTHSTLFVAQVVVSPPAATLVSPLSSGLTPKRS